MIGPEVSTHVVPVTDFLPIDDASGPPPVTRVRSVLVVVDTTNTPPGQRGTVTVHEIRAETLIEVATPAPPRAQRGEWKPEVRGAGVIAQLATHTVTVRRTEKMLFSVSVMITSIV